MSKEVDGEEKKKKRKVEEEGESVGKQDKGKKKAQPEREVTAEDQTEATLSMLKSQGNDMLEMAGAMGNIAEALGDLRYKVDKLFEWKKEMEKRIEKMQRKMEESDEEDMKV